MNIKLNSVIMDVYIGNYYEVNASTVRKYYYLNGQRVAMRENGTKYFLLTDHLGSTGVTLNADGTFRSELRYKAWGETRYVSGSTPTRYTYTGQFSYMDDFGLMYYNARWYDAALGRFVQPDTIIPDPSNTLDWDRYSYVRNNPVRFTDPSGHFTADEVCKYWRYCSEDEARKGLGNLFDIIYGTDITWGDLLVYKNEKSVTVEAMFVLMASDKDGKYVYSAGLWSVTGGYAVGWDEVKGLQQVAGYGYDPKSKTSRVRTVGMSTSDLWNWYGGKDPQKHYTPDDLWVGNPEDIGYSFSTYVDLGFMWWVDVGVFTVGIVTRSGPILVIDTVLTIVGYTTDVFGQGFGPVDKTYPVIFHDPLLPGMFPYQLHFTPPRY